METNQPEAAPLHRQGLYVFCIAAARPGMKPSLEREVARLGPFAGGEPLGVLPLAAPRSPAEPELYAIACRVSLDEWGAGDGAGGGRRADMAWLGPRAIRHQEVIEPLMARGAVLPLRFGSLFRDEARLGAAVERQRDAVLTYLGQAAGHEEWVLTGVLEASERPDPDDASTAWQPEDEHELARWIDGLARARRSLPRAQGPGPVTVLRWALLVPRVRLAELMQQLEEREGELLQRGLVLEARGPWPPYSFAPTLPNKDEDKDDDRGEDKGEDGQGA